MDGGGFSDGNESGSVAAFDNAGLLDGFENSLNGQSITLSSICLTSLISELFSIPPVQEAVRTFTSNKKVIARILTATEKFKFQLQQQSNGVQSQVRAHAGQVQIEYPAAGDVTARREIDLAQKMYLQVQNKKATAPATSPVTNNMAFVSKLSRSAYKRTSTSSVCSNKKSKRTKLAKKVNLIQTTLNFNSTRRTTLALNVDLERPTSEATALHDLHQSTTSTTKSDLTIHQSNETPSTSKVLSATPPPTTVAPPPPPPSYVEGKVDFGDCFM